MLNLLKEAAIVGVLIVAIGTVTSFVVGKFYESDLPPACSEWNKNLVMEACLFFTGFVAHIVFEKAGLNKWYCRNGVACVKTD